MKKGSRAHYTWVYDPKSKPGTKSPDSVKKQVSDAAEEILVTWRAEFLKPVPKNHPYNYLSELHTHWRGNYFSFCGTYLCPGPNARAPSFQTCFARLEYLGKLGFNLAFMASNDEWVQIEQAVSLEECLKEVRTNEFYHPR